MIQADPPFLTMRTFLPIVLAALCDLVGGAALTSGSPSGDLVQVVFSPDRLTLQAVWSNNFTTMAMLEGEQREHCIFPGKWIKDQGSKVLVTGCDLEDEPSVQIQSAKFGDYFLSIKRDGSIKLLEHDDEEEDYEEFLFVSDYVPGVAAGQNGRVKREDDYEYDYGEEFDFVAEDLADLPNLDDYEVDDIDLPVEVELQINLYLDPSFLKKFGSKAESKAKQAVSQAALLMQHDSLDTKIKLVLNTVHTSDLHIAMSSRSVATKDFQIRVPSLLKPPFSVGEHPVAQLYLTYSAVSVVKGIALRSSICGERQKPLAIVVWNKEEARTGVTIAHELGHTLGMQHDFTKDDQRTNQKCGAGKTKGVYILNYGNKPRRTVWSQCSNEDFKVYYSKVIVGPAHKYCLKTTKEANLGCEPNQFQCLNGACIPGSQKCDFLRRDCPNGEDEADCDFDGEFDF